MTSRFRVHSILVPTFPAIYQKLGTTICERRYGAEVGSLEMLVPKTSFLYRNEETSIFRQPQVLMESAKMLVPSGIRKLPLLTMGGNKHLQPLIVQKRNGKAKSALAFPVVRSCNRRIATTVQRTAIGF